MTVDLPIPSVKFHLSSHCFSSILGCLESCISWYSHHCSIHWSVQKSSPILTSCLAISNLLGIFDYGFTTSRTCSRAPWKMQSSGKGFLEIIGGLSPRSSVFNSHLVTELSGARSCLLNSVLTLVPLTFDSPSHLTSNPILELKVFDFSQWFVWIDLLPFFRRKNILRGRNSIQLSEFFPFPETVHDVQTYARAYSRTVSALNNTFLWALSQLGSKRCRFESRCRSYFFQKNLNTRSTNVIFWYRNLELFWKVRNIFLKKFFFRLIWSDLTFLGTFKKIGRSISISEKKPKSKKFMNQMKKFFKGRNNILFSFSGSVFIATVLFLGLKVFSSKKNFYYKMSFCYAQVEWIPKVQYVLKIP